MSIHLGVLNVRLTTDFEQLYKKHQPALVSYARYLIGDAKEAEQLVNDVFLAVWKKRDTLTLDDTIRPYLYTGTKNKCFNYSKKKKQPFTLDRPEEKAGDYHADSNIRAKESADLLEQILNSLPPKCRQIFIMSRMDGLKNREIATLLEVSIKTVENQMTKALKIFKKNIGSA